MRARISILSLLLLFISTAVFAQNVKSDYEIQKSFKQKYKLYQNKLDTVSSPDRVKALMDSIKVFDSNYQDNYELLNKALYPDTYSEKMDELRQSSVNTLNRLRTIKQQSEQMTTLQQKLNGYEQSLQLLNQHADSLKEAMNKSVASEKHLSSMVRKYRSSLEKRDDLIMAFIDSTVVAYQQMDINKMQNLENVDNPEQLKSNGDALKMIHDISQQNLQILKKNSDNLQLQDYMRMSKVENQFEGMWDRLGDKITEVYNGKNADQLASEITKNLSEWNQMLRDQTLAVLNDTLQSNGINLKSFDSPEGLYSSLNTYLDEKIKHSKNGGSESYQDFKRFQQFWNKVELQWSNNFADAGLLTQDQMASIDSKVDMWAENAKPAGSNNLLVYLLGASVLLAVALGVMLIREKKSNSKKS
ncbi:MAG TPA: hypothetical protein VJ964_11695 [Balneolaceae bacterium]|nr:hypothetical protein [Balneolaceae bacterium]